MSGLVRRSFAAVLLIAAGCSTSTPHARSAPTTLAETVAPTNAPTTTTTAAEDDEGPIDPTAPSVPPASGTPASSATQCRSGDPLANVYHPSRLQLIRPCVAISGTVMSVRHEDDGDVHFDLRVSPSLVNAGNVAHQHGWLVIEIVPADEPGCVVGTPPRPASGTYNYGTCTGANVQTTRIGAHVTVTGPYVLDSNHGWMEVHPVWSIAAGNTTIPAPPNTPRPTSPPQPPPTGGVYYANCAAARAAGAAPIHRGQPGYRPALDRDSDGIACE